MLSHTVVLSRSCIIPRRSRARRLGRLEKKWRASLTSCCGKNVKVVLRSSWRQSVKRWNRVASSPGEANRSVVGQSTFLSKRLRVRGTYFIYMACTIRNFAGHRCYSTTTKFQEAIFFQNYYIKL